jgi:hypothetical protein
LLLAQGKNAEQVFEQAVDRSRGALPRVAAIYWNTMKWLRIEQILRS